MKKKILAALVCAAAVLSTTACNSSEDKLPESGTSSTGTPGNSDSVTSEDTGTGTSGDSNSGTDTSDDSNSGTGASDNKAPTLEDYSFPFYEGEETYPPESEWTSAELFYCDENRDGAISISGFQDDEKYPAEIIFPKTIGGKPVTEIAGFSD